MHLKRTRYCVEWWVWGNLCKAKGDLHIHSILAYANFSKPLKLHTNVCTLEFGAILYQNQHGVDHVKGYACRSLSKTECKYLAHKLEFLTLTWAIMEQFQKHLYGNYFVIYMDKLDATGHCWVASLANYNFALSYQSGNMNPDADALSYIPRGSTISIFRLTQSVH